MHQTFQPKPNTKSLYFSWGYEREVLAEEGGSETWGPDPNFSLYDLNDCSVPRGVCRLHRPAVLNVLH